MIDQLFGSKTRAKLLHLFFNHPNQPFYVREITRKIDEQINSVRRELSNLLSIGIITSMSKNNRLFYEVNQNYTHYKAMSQIFTSIGEDLPIAKEADPLQKRLRDIGSVKLVYLLGSFVQDPNMNVDILIIGDVNRSKLQKLVGQLETEEGRELNFMTMTETEYDYRRDINDRFLSDIMHAKKSVLIDDLTTAGAKT